MGYSGFGLCLERKKKRDSKKGQLVHSKEGQCSVMFYRPTYMAIVKWYYMSSEQELPGDVGVAGRIITVLVILPQSGLCYSLQP